MRKTFARRPLRQRVIALVAAYAIALASLVAGFGAAQAAAEAVDGAGVVICHSDLAEGPATGPHDSNGAICLKSCIGCMTSLATVIPPTIAAAGPPQLSFKRLDLPARAGQLVLIKIALFAAMVALASVNRFYLTPRLATAGTVRRLCHTSVAETGLGFAVVAVVGFLGVMAPASHTHPQPANAIVPEGAAFVHIHSNAGMADVTIVPGRVGTAQARIRLWNEEFEPLAAERLTVTFTPPEVGAKPVMRSAVKDQDGSWKIDAIALSRAGNWTVTIDAGLDAKRRLLLDAPIVIEPER